MYSRAPRKFLTPDPDHANPNLGPGCYTADEATLIAGKTLGENGYAPFASLAPRVSYFDETVIHGPSPGAYDPPLQPFVIHNTEKASLFGKSRAIRFKDIVSFTPSPNTYSLPSSLKKKNKGLSSDDPRYKKAMDHGKLGDTITYQALLAAAEKKGDGIATAADGSVTVAGDEEDAVNFLSQESAAIEGISKLESIHGGEGDTVKAKKGSKISIPKKAPPVSAKKPTIVWRRKYVPPSIPVGHSAFGYQENDTGELVPRSPPKKNMDPGPAYNFVTSFVEKNKHENNGYRFAKEKKGLKFKVTDSPGPNVYDVSFAEKLMRYRDFGNGPAVMTLAPCVRLTDEIVTDALKKAVPGPGAYEFKTSIKNPRLAGTNVPAFGSSSNHMAPSNYIPTDLMKTPAPGAYYPEFATINKPPAFRPQPFGSTTHRFDSTAEERSKQLPAPGSYELATFEQINIRDRRVRLMTPGGTRPKAFGSVSERFIKPRAPKVPGPGQYDIANIPPPPPPSTSNKRNGNIHTGLPSRKTTPSSPIKQRKKKPLVIVQPIGTGASVDPQKVRIPVFGSQTARFHKFDDADDLPPPGAYEIAQAFETLKTKGRIEKQSMLGSQMTRELFPPPPSVPGPGEYDAFPQARRRTQHQHGAFLSSKLRFNEKAEPVPGPDAYLAHDYDNGLIKKSFNITMREWAEFQSS
ncbi:UNVERIFIED_CONTAM: Sperm-tail PG-rich repeat-containing protein 2 [Siphonaria sp. JEL0065]|nr:Sperm-tail PG-rich repeat-containing protein 2 [Siphonaria sp. JEL0065]